MTQNFLNKLKEKSYNKKCFYYFDKGEYKICDNLGDLPFGNITLGEYLENEKKAQNELENKVKALTEALQKLTKIQEGK